MEFYIFFFSPHNIIEVVVLYVSKMRKYGNNTSALWPISKTDVEPAWLNFLRFLIFYIWFVLIYGTIWGPCKNKVTLQKFEILYQIPPHPAPPLTEWHMEWIACHSKIASFIDSYFSSPFCFVSYSYLANKNQGSATITHFFIGNSIFHLSLELLTKFWKISCLAVV